jgi:hypothetical protein
MSIVIDGGGSITGLTATGISAVQQLPAGSVIQVVNGSLTTAVTTTSASYVDTGLTASITPKFASSKILVIVNLNCLSDTGGGIAIYNLLRGSTTVIAATTSGDTATYAGWMGNGGFATPRATSGASIQFLDNPTTTSSTTYKVQFRNNSGADTISVNRWGLNNDSSAVSTITLMEIAQ